MALSYKQAFEVAELAVFHRQETLAAIFEPSGACPIYPSSAARAIAMAMTGLDDEKMILDAAEDAINALEKPLHAELRHREQRWKG